jgi:hypothetical protein
MSSESISSTLNHRAENENKEVNPIHEFENGVNIYPVYYRKETLKMKKLFYMRLAILLMLINLFLIINTFGQLVTVNNITITNSAQITIKGDLLNNSGAAITNSGTIDMTGNFTNNSGSSLFGSSSGTVELNGANQDIAGNDLTTFYNLTLSGSGVKTMQQHAEVGGNNGTNAGILSLGSQVLDLNSKTLTVTNQNANAITRTTGYAVSETDAISGYGTITWMVKNNTGNYIFPFGNNVSASYLPVTFEVNTPGNGANGYISLSTYPTVTSNLPNNRPLPAGLTSLIDMSGTENAHNVVDRWWVMDVGNYTTDPVSSITLTYRDSEWDGTAGSTNTLTESALQAQSNDGSLWTPSPMGFVNTAQNTVTINNINIYNPIWTLVGNSDPLPIELLTFDAKLNKNEHVDLDWATAAEVNNDYFTVEKSKDGINFEILEYVDGAGNSTNMNYYHLLDKKPFEGITYYRLMQTDFDGQHSYSEIKAVRMEHVADGTFSVFPNPATDHFFVKFDEETSTQDLFIMDMNGKMLREIHLAETQVMGSGLIKVNRMELPAGMYFVTTLEGKMEKLVLQ